MTQKPLILAVETSSRTGSVAVARGKELLAETTFSGPMKHSAEIFPAMGELMRRFDLTPGKIEHVYIAIGPGSFTGLRIATTLAKSMHLANGARIVAVDTLDAIAANLIDYTRPPDLSAICHSGPSGHDANRHAESVKRIAAILDAKRNQFFIAAYERAGRASATADEGTKRTATSDGVWVKVAQDCLMTAAQFVARFSESGRPIWLLGDGLLYHRDKFQAQGMYLLDERYWSPRASKVHLLGWRKAVAGQFADPVTLQPTYLRKPNVTVKQG